MQLHWIDYVVIGLYLSGTLYLGFFLHKRASKNIDSFFLGDRQLPWWALGASGMASNVDVAGTMIIAALVYAMGVRGLFVEIRGGLVLILPFLMVFMGKWTRRARVMTSAEWMKLRFGETREGRIARLMSAVANLVIHVWIITYFVVGGGKFFAAFTGIDGRWAAVALVLLTMCYATVSGFYGVVWTDVFQGTIVLCGIVYLVSVAMTHVNLPASFPVSLPDGHGGFLQHTALFSEWSSIKFPWRLHMPGQYSAYNLFGVTIMFYFAKTCIEGFGGAGGYMSQRYFAAKSDRDAGLLSVFWIALLAFRWPLVTSIAVLAIHYSLAHGPLGDPELVLPTVIANYAPVGMRGFLVACFMAAAMSAFVAVINSSAAYWTQDIYHAYLNRGATNRQLMFQSRASGILVVSLGLLFSFPVVNINDIWGWLTLAFGVGLSVPLLLCWYWWRYNGYGFACGTLTGMVAAVLTRYAGVPVPEYAQFLIPGVASLLGCLVGTYVTAPTDAATLANFFSITRPFGFWRPVLGRLPLATQRSIRAENRRDLWATAFAVPWMFTLCLMGMVLVLKRWDELAALGVAWALLSVGLYWNWFRHLQSATEAKLAG